MEHEEFKEKFKQSEDKLMKEKMEAELKIIEYKISDIFSNIDNMTTEEIVKQTFILWRKPKEIFPDIKLTEEHGKCIHKILREILPKDLSIDLYGLPDDFFDKPLYWYRYDQAFSSEEEMKEFYELIEKHIYPNRVWRHSGTMRWYYTMNKEDLDKIHESLQPYFKVLDEIHQRERSKQQDKEVSNG